MRKEDTRHLWPLVLVIDRVTWLSSFGHWPSNAVPNDPVFGVFRGKLHLFAYITPCKTDGKDASQELTFYHTETAPIITDLTTIRAMVGRIQTTGGMTNRKQWGIIDRSTALVRTAFEHKDLSDVVTMTTNELS
jgi:hypothetical protein